MMSALLIYAYGRFALYLVLEYSSPSAFVDYVVKPIPNLLKHGHRGLGNVAFRVPLLGQSIRNALRRDDGEGLGAALTGLEELQGFISEAAIKDPKIRDRSAGRDVANSWLGDELRRQYVGITEEALRLKVPQEEIDAISNFFTSSAISFVGSGFEVEAKSLLDGLVQIATTPFQFSSDETTYLSRVAVGIAYAEQEAQKKSLFDLAGYALACWAATVLYAEARFSAPHRQYPESIQAFGEDPQWDIARAYVTNESWQFRWVNQLGDNLRALPGVLDMARFHHDGTVTEEFMERKKESYLSFLQTVDAMPTAKTGEFLFELISQLQDLMAFLDLTASPEVRSCIHRYSDLLDESLPQIRAAFFATGPTGPSASIKRIMNKGSVKESRQAMIQAMKDDVGERFFEGIR